MYQKSKKIFFPIVDIKIHILSYKLLTILIYLLLNGNP